jgi:hypothetical protein
MYLTDRLERECEIYFRARQMAKPIPLTSEEIQALHRRDLTYGQDAPAAAEAKQENEVSPTTSDDSSCDEKE